MPAQNPRDIKIILVICLLTGITSLFVFSTSRLPQKFHLSESAIGAFLASPQVSCPSPYDAGRMAVVHDGQTCEAIPSKSSEFDVEVCYQPQLCNSFTLRLKRNNSTACQVAENGPDPSTDPALSNWIRSNRGPDAFLVRTDGAERFASVSDAYEGNCTYAFDISLKNAGMVYLQAWWTYSNYQGYSDTDKTWPELYLSLIDTPIALDLCPSDCSPATPVRLLPNATVFSVPQIPFGLEPAPSLPPCSGNEPIRGSYLPAHPLDVLYPPIKLPRGGDYPIVGHYNFVTEACNWEHSGKRFSKDLDKCTNSKKKVLFLGDSHGRVAGDAIVHRLRGKEDVLAVSSKSESKEVTIGNTLFRFMWDPRATELFKPNFCEKILQDADVVVVSIASHLSSSRFYSTSEYNSTLHKIFNIVASCPTGSGSPRKFVYLTAPAAPPRSDEYAQKYADHRTNVRLQHWNDLGVRIALDKDWAVVDQFALTLPHNLEPLHTDKAHYLSTDALNPIVDEVLGKMGICDA